MITMVPLAALLGMLALTGCASFAYTIPTRAPAGQTVAESARDTRECEVYAKRQPESDSYPHHPGHHYAACLVARGHAVNVEFNQLDWLVGLMQERPHDTATVLGNVVACDQRADDAKDADGSAVTLTQAQESSTGRGSIASNGSQFEAPQNRKNAIRVLVHCLGERGYVVVPLVPVSGGGR